MIRFCILLVFTHGFVYSEVVIFMPYFTPLGVAFPKFFHSKFSLTLYKETNCLFEEISQLASAV